MRAAALRRCPLPVWLSLLPGMLSSAVSACVSVRAGRQATDDKQKKQSAGCARPTAALLSLAANRVDRPPRPAALTIPTTPTIGSGKRINSLACTSSPPRIDASAPAAQPEHTARLLSTRSSLRTPRRPHPPCPSLDPLVRWAASSLKDSSCAHPKQPHTACASVQTSRAIWPRTCAPTASNSCALASCARQRRSQQGEKQP